MASAQSIDAPAAGPPNPYQVQMSNRNLAIAAWDVTVLISALPDIVFSELSGSVPAWLPLAKIGLLLVMTLVAIIWRPLRPLRNFSLMMIAFFGLTELRPRIDFNLPFLEDLFGNTVFDGRMQSEQTGKLVVTCQRIHFNWSEGWGYRATIDCNGG